MNMKRALIAATVLLLVSGIIFAQQRKDLNVTGKALLDKMNSSSVGDKEYVRGYIVGVFCASRSLDVIPDDLTMKKIEEVAKKYLEENPKKLSRPANELLKEAWAKPFPIRGK